MKPNASKLIADFKSLAFLLVLLFALFPLIGQATVITVPGDYSTIQAAINTATDDDEIIVSPGTYQENVNFLGKNIILRSIDATSPTIVASTVIDGNSSGSVVTFSGTEDETGVLSGFTITNGYALKGGGICGNGARSAIQNNNITTNTTYGSGINARGAGVYDCDGVISSNTISDNSAGGDGGGLVLCGGTIQNNIVSNNTAGDDGGGLFQCDGTIRDNIISGNSAGDNGGGLFQCDATIQNNIISGNSADDGGGLYGCRRTVCNNIISGNSAYWGGGLSNCEGTILNNTIWGNSANYGGGLIGCRGFIINCIIWANSAPTDSQLRYCSMPFYSCIQGWTSDGISNISSDPELVDPSNGNYHLQPSSPCIDAGNKYYLHGYYIADIDGECRLVGGAVDMGSDEYGSALDNDGDLLTDIQESIYGTDPDHPDTDRDNLMDGIEVIRGTDPNVYRTAPGMFIPSQYSSIQKGLFLAHRTEVVTVLPGTYYENLHLLGKSLTLRSANPFNEHIVDTTIIDGSALFSAVFFHGRESQFSALKGLTIRNGSGYNGGGICGNRNFATIEYNKISGNSALSEGGGISSCHGLIQNNIISGNSAHEGGGIAWCGGTVQNNIISHNTAFYGGGAAVCFGTVKNNIVSKNSATYGGGFYSCSAPLQNNTICDNSAQYGGGISDCWSSIVNCIITGNENYGIYEVNLGRDPDEVKYCDIYGNTSGDYYDYDTTASYTGTNINNLPEVHDCISDDPQLVDPDNGDFRLQSTSPCLDAGCYVPDLSRDFEGDHRPYYATSEPRGDGSHFDIGADERMPPSTAASPQLWSLYK